MSDIYHLYKFDMSYFRGKSKKAGKKVLEPFRKDFGSLSSLRSFCPGKGLGLVDHNTYLS